MIANCLILTILYVICLPNTVMANETKKVVCYHGTWSAHRKSLGKFDVATNIDPLLCTHLMYAFIGIQETGELKIKDPHLDLEENNGLGNIRKFNALKLRNPNLKTMISVGGGSAAYEFSIVAADPIKITKFVQAAIEFLHKYSFNGLDIDWEYPNQRHNNDCENFVTLLKELKEGFQPFGYILTAAVGPAEYLPQRSYNIAEMVKYLDFINVMAYDLHGPWELVVGINAPLYPGPLDTTERAKQHSFDALAKYWINNGAPREKLIMGVPFYGRSYILEDPNNHVVGAPHNGPGIGGQYSIQSGILGYNELCEKFQNEKSLWNLAWETKQMVPYAYNGDQWIGYENERSIALKVDYVQNENLGGIMIWTIELDDFHGTCGSKRYPLLSVINEKLFGTIPST